MTYQSISDSSAFAHEKITISDLNIGDVLVYERSRKTILLGEYSICEIFPHGFDASQAVVLVRQVESKKYFIFNARVESNRFDLICPRSVTFKENAEAIVSTRQKLNRK
ncbi:MAG: hypothetical protein LBE57_04715 [Methanosarcinales archaeon]|jgi:hypothetical protein|nr:hypothetical protein [Methanosarcinales archaeon]